MELADDKTEVLAGGDPGRQPRLGRYRLERRIGSGGMAEVFLARAEGPGGFEKQVVIKRIRRELAANKRFIDMFVREARVLARLDHPNIVRIVEFDEQGGEHFLALEYLRGLSLRDVVERHWAAGRSLPLESLMQIVADACLGLEHAHRFRDANGQPAGLVHRDVSPDNLFVTTTGLVKVLDFGIAKAVGFDELTQTGELKGKIPFMSPEQLMGHPLDGRSDLWATGVILHWLLTGRRPFAAEGDLPTIKAILEDPRPPVRSINPRIPAVLDQLVAALLERNRDLRLQTAATLHDTLMTLLAALPGAAVPPASLVAVAQQLPPVRVEVVPTGPAAVPMLPWTDGVTSPTEDAGIEVTATRRGRGSAPSINSLIESALSVSDSAVLVRGHGGTGTIEPDLEDPTHVTSMTVPESARSREQDRSSAAEQASGDGAAAAEVHLSAEHLSAEQLSAEHLSAEHLSAEHLSAEHLSAEHLSAAHLSAEQLSAAHLSAEQLSAAHVSAEQLSAAHLSAEHLSAEQQNGWSSDPLAGAHPAEPGAEWPSPAMDAETPWSGPTAEAGAIGRFARIIPIAAGWAAVIIVVVALWQSGALARLLGRGSASSPPGDQVAPLPAGQSDRDAAFASSRTSLGTVDPGVAAPGVALTPPLRGPTPKRGSAEPGTPATGAGARPDIAAPGGDGRADNDRDNVEETRVGRGGVRRRGGNSGGSSAGSSVGNGVGNRGGTSAGTGAAVANVAPVVVVNVAGPRSVQWQGPGGEVYGSGSGALRLPEGTRTLVAVDARRGVRTRVPIEPGARIEYAKLPRQQLTIRVRPYAEVFLGRESLGVTPLEPVQVVVGTHDVKLVYNNAEKIVSVEVTAEKPAVLNVVMTK